MTTSLLLNNRIFTFLQILEGDYGNISDYEKEVLSFCKDWLSGKKEFRVSTSGTTGPAKLLTFHREQMALSAQATAKALQLQEGDTALVCLNTTYIAGKMMLVRGFETGMNLVIVSPSSNPFAEIPASQHIDFAAFVPLQLMTMLQENPDAYERLNQMKAIILGGAPVSLALQEMVQKIKVPVYHTYGMTETLTHIALRRLNGTEQQDYFTVLENTEIKSDSRGCLMVKSPVTGNEWITTNDLAEILDEKNFHWNGRIDNIINSGGIKIPAEKIEAAAEKIFAELNISSRFFVAGTSHPELGEAVTLFVEGNSEGIDKDLLLKKMKGILPVYEAPKAVVFVERFRETETGKVERIKNEK